MAFNGPWTQAHARTAVAPHYSLIDLLVWGADLPIDTSTYGADVQQQVAEVQQRSEAYRSKRVTPPESESALLMVFDAQVRYERLLVAAATIGDAAASAAKYVSALKPCYEWEGFPECPEHEARFAADYQRTHHDGPFQHYLPLLEAHRWLCASEAHRVPAAVGRTRRAYHQALAVAKQSQSPLVRTAAAELESRARCFADQ